MGNKLTQQQKISKLIELQRNGRVSKEKQLSIVRPKLILMLKLISIEEDSVNWGTFGNEINRDAKRDKILTFENSAGETFSLRLSRISKVEDFYVHNINLARVRSRDVLVKNSEQASYRNFSFHILNKVIDRNGVIKERRESETYTRDLAKWDEARKYNLKARIANTGKVYFVNNRLYYSPNPETVDAIVPKCTECFEPSMFQRCLGLKTVRYNSDAFLPDRLFLNLQTLEKVIFLGSPKSIGCSAFQLSGITEIDLPKSISKVANGAFSNCKNLKSVKFNGVLKYLGEFAFNGCSALEELILPNGFEKLLTQTVCGCYNLKRLKIPKSVTFISEGTFGKMSSFKNTTVEVPKHLKEQFSNVINKDHVSFLKVVYY